MRVAFVIFCFWAGLSLASAQTPLEPFDIMRQIVNAQDHLLTGRPDAVAETKRLDGQFIETVRSAPKETWRAQRNRRALALYLLAGGDPAAAREARVNWPESSDENKLYDGALAFAEGREKEALEILGPFEPRALPADIGGQVALAQGVLSMDRDPKKAMAALDLARLLAPGALVEEAALRRQVFLASNGEDCTRFVALSERYRLRFAHSAFSENFETRFHEGFLKFWTEGGQSAQSILENFLQDLSKDERAALLLSAARSAMLSGKLQAAAAAAEMARAALAPQDPRLAQAIVYASATQVLDNQFDETKLTGAPNDKLSKEDQILRAAVVIVAVARKNTFEAATPEPADETEIMGRAKAVIGAANTLLQGAKK